MGECGPGVAAAEFLSAEDEELMLGVFLSAVILYGHTCGRVVFLRTCSLHTFVYLVQYSSAEA